MNWVGKWTGKQKPPADYSGCICSFLWSSRGRIRAWTRFVMCSLKCSQFSGISCASTSIDLIWIFNAQIKLPLYHNHICSLSSTFPGIPLYHLHHHHHHLKSFLPLSDSLSFPPNITSDPFDTTDSFHPTIFDQFVISISSIAIISTINSSTLIAFILKSVYSLHI